jgi:hypothetical protein
MFAIISLLINLEFAQFQIKPNQKYCYEAFQTPDRYHANVADALASTDITLTHPDFGL